MQGHTGINSNQVQSSSSNNINNVTKWVVTISSSPLTPAQESLSSKGPNFALAPTNPPNVEFILAVESVCQRLSELDAQELQVGNQLLTKKGQNPQFQHHKGRKEAIIRAKGRPG